MEESTYYVVECFSEKYVESDDTENKHNLALPIVAGPFDTVSEAEEAASYENYAVVTVYDDKVPDDWDED